MTQLTPFKKTSLTEPFQIISDIKAISPYELRCSFEVRGPLSSIVWPNSQTPPRREDELWNHTCFEVFWGSSSLPDSPYFEVNCAPHGSWNIYEFSAYRTGMMPSIEKNLQRHQYTQTPESSVLAFSIVSTTPLVIDCVGLTAVIEFTSGEKSYWSLHHPGEKPDFHNKEGWRQRTFAAR